MPKNFQTSQYDEPIAFDGYLDVTLDDGEVVRVEIERAHMEEDTGKSLHIGGATGRIHGAEHSLLDYNRAACAADRDRDQADHRHRRAGARGGARVRHRTARPAAGARRVRRPHGPGLAALRRERVADGQGRDGIRHAHRDEERQLAAQRRARGAVRDDAPGGDSRRRRVDPAGDAALPGGRRHHVVWSCQGNRGGLPVLPGARPRADRAVARVGRGAARDAAGDAVGAAQADPGRVEALRRSAARPAERRCRRPRRCDGRGWRDAGRGARLVGQHAGAGSEHARGRADRAGDHAGCRSPR